MGEQPGDRNVEAIRLVIKYWLLVMFLIIIIAFIYNGN